MIELILFIFLYTIYTVLLFIKYSSQIFINNMHTVIEGYFIVNLFFLAVMYPVKLFHNEVKTKEYFLNIESFSKIIKIIFLIVSIIFIGSMYKLRLPFDVMGSFFIWFYLYFSKVLIKKN